MLNTEYGLIGILMAVMLFIYLNRCFNSYLYDRLLNKFSCRRKPHEPIFVICTILSGLTILAIFSIPHIVNYILGDS